MQPFRLPGNRSSQNLVQLGHGSGTGRGAFCCVSCDHCSKDCTDCSSNGPDSDLFPCVNLACTTALHRARQLISGHFLSQSFIFKTLKWYTSASLLKNLRFKRSSIKLRWASFCFCFSCNELYCEVHIIMVLLF